MKHATMIAELCDVDTLMRFKRPDIACNAGRVCEHMTDYIKGLDNDEVSSAYATLAIGYYRLTLEFAHVTETENLAFEIQDAMDGINKLTQRLGNTGKNEPGRPQNGSEIPDKKCVFH